MRLVIGEVEFNSSPDETEDTRARAASEARRRSVMFTRVHFCYSSVSSVGRLRRVRPTHNVSVSARSIDDP